MVRKRKSIQTCKKKRIQLKQCKINIFAQKPNKTYEKSLFYYPNFSQAVQKIADLKSTTKDFSDINEFLKEYKIISNQIKEYTDGIRSTI